MSVPSTGAEVLEADGVCTLRFRRELSHAPEHVWAALTRREYLEVWFPSPPEADIAAAARLSFRFPDEGAPPLTGTVAAFEPPWALEYTWDTDLLRFELRPARLAARSSGGTRLQFSQTFSEPARAVRDASGWHTCLDVLETWLDGSPAPWTIGQLWSEVHAEYAADFDAAHHADCVCTPGNGAART